MKTIKAIILCSALALALAAALPSLAAEFSPVGTWNMNFDWTCNGMDDNIEVRWVFREDGAMAQVRYYDDGTEPSTVWGSWTMYEGGLIWMHFNTTQADFSGQMAANSMSGQINAPTTGCFTATSRYRDNGNGTVTSAETGLIWEKNDQGGGSWYDVNTYCSELELGGRDDWGLPTREQLEALEEKPKVDGKLDRVFNNRNSDYWTADSCGNEGGHYAVSFASLGESGCRERTAGALVRCVVGGSVSPVPGDTSQAEYVKHLYNAALGRDPVDDELTSWAISLRLGNRYASDLVQNIFGSMEYTGRNLGDRDHINTVYEALYGRQPTGDELSHFAGLLGSGAERDKILKALIFTVEFKNFCARYDISSAF